MTSSVNLELPGRQEHDKYLQRAPKHDTLSEATASPIFTSSLWKASKQLLEDEESSRDSSSSSCHPFPQYSLLAGDLDVDSEEADPRIFYNVAVPSSIFVCGSQGSGKSHTLSCILEGCLSKSTINELPRPLTGLLFHYDPFASEFGGAPCEAAYLALKSDIKVRVLCAPTNFNVIQETYKKIPNVHIESLQLDQSDLNTRRMRDLMAINDSNVPLYQHVIEKILREMRLDQQQTGASHSFDYRGFKQRIWNEHLTPAQLNPLNQRLGTLESFMSKAQINLSITGRKKSDSGWKGTKWDDVAGQLTIVDLSCPCVGADIACSLFNICLFLFLQMKNPDALSAANAEELIKPQRMGRIVALDEAHKYMTADAATSPECRTLTNSLLHVIRMQRHLGVRVVISTQEPTVSPKLLDLCSITIVHRFTSPAWMTALKAHLAGGDGRSKKGGKAGNDDDEDSETEDLFNQIISLKVGEARLFAPGAIVGLEEKKSKDRSGGRNKSGGKSDMEVKRLGARVLNVRVRQRVTADGGATLMAK